MAERKNDLQAAECLQASEGLWYDISEELSELSVSKKRPKVLNPKRPKGRPKKRRKLDQPTMNVESPSNEESKHPENQ